MYGADVVFSEPPLFRMIVANEKHIAAEWFGNHYALTGMTSRAGELAALTGQNNPYPDAKLGVIEVGAYADILLVDGNPLEDVTILVDANNIDLVMKDGVIYKDELP